MVNRSAYVRQYGLGPEHYGSHEVRWLYAVVSDVLVLSLFFLILYLFWAMGSLKEPSEPDEPGTP
ncbi:MAG: hypothetical protein JSW03_00550 [Candidatus Eiseniibacteriota bacterium]|nr:MAG: hypothetical protein JSW03_00550 [Candidatus Eisenbacteria bacterium]